MSPLRSQYLIKMGNSMIVFTESNLISLVYTTRQDLPFVIETETTPENAQFVAQWPYERHETALLDEDIIHLLVKNKDDANVGYVIIRGASGQGDNIELMRIAISKKGCGYGKNALSLIKKWCFEEQKAHRLWLDVRERNSIAQHLYESQGFVREGLLRECVKVDNVYESLYVMSILASEYSHNS